jgi:nucleoside-diphosphate-sugar epimerase
MKVLIYGAKGWIGGMMCNLLSCQNIEYVASSVRVSNKKEIEEELIYVKPTHVMSFIGRTHGIHEGKKYTTIDYLEQKGKIVDNVRDNLFSPMVLALLCSKHNIHFTYLGTGCIFKYDDEHPYGNDSTGFTEESLPNFFGSSYSVVKGYTDELMHFFDDSVLNLRIRMPITDKLEPRNFITKITTYEYICSIPNAMTVLDELLPYALDMAKKGTTGTINLTNPGLVSHNEILDMYKEIVDPSFTWKNFSLEDQAKILAADRSNNSLDSNKLQTLYPEVKHIKDSVRNVLERMKKI